MASKKSTGKCVPGTAKYVKGGGCACRTKGGGFKFIDKGICKRKYNKSPKRCKFTKSGACVCRTRGGGVQFAKKSRCR